MPNVRCLLLVLASTFVVPSLVANAAEPLALTDDMTCSSARTADSGGAITLAQYITREEQQRRANENLERHRQERANPTPPVDRSTNTTTGETYGREYQERQLQGDKPRTRTW